MSRAPRLQYPGLGLDFAIPPGISVSAINTSRSGPAATVNVRSALRAVG